MFHLVHVTIGTHNLNLNLKKKSFAKEHQNNLNH